jgi:hypothetical protein
MHQKLTGLTDPAEESRMKIRKLPVLVIAILVLLHTFAFITEGAAPDPAQLRRRLLHSIGVLPENLSAGYRLDGQFTLRANGEEIPYAVRYLRAANRWVADFTQENPSRNLRYFSSGKEAWIHSPEITVDATPRQLPYMAQFDPHQLYNALLQILERGSRDPAFALNTSGNEIYVRGKLSNGWEAVFVLNTIEYFPRKIRINTTGNPAAAWVVPVTGTNGTYSAIRIPEPATEFEIWLSDPAENNGYRYAQRLDFLEHGIVLGTFIVGESAPIAGAEALFNRPPSFPWEASAQFIPNANADRPSMYLNDSELSALRDKITQAPWTDWDRASGWIAVWATLTFWIGRLFPYILSIKLLKLFTAIVFLGFLFLLLRRYRQSHRRKFSWGMLTGGFVVAGLIFIAGSAAYLISRPQDRSRMALHTAIRYIVANHPLYASSTDKLLTGITRKTPAQSLEELSRSCQAYALAYDLIRKSLSPERRLQIETDLFNYARPLFGAAQGWGSNGGEGILIASGLGMTGLAIGFEPYITAAQNVLDKTLPNQLAGGLYRAGPGEGIRAMDAAVNLFYGLKHAGRADYYNRAELQKYVQTTLQMLSPVGTIPLFGNTGLEHSRELSLLFLKTASQLPPAIGRQCITAHNLYWNHGRYASEGWIKWVLPLFQPMLAYFENPYVFLQYTRNQQPAALQASSAVLGNGQSVILRSGSAPDSLYLALNLLRSPAYEDHRDMLGFDLYAYQSLLAHGPGSPGKTAQSYEETLQTEASNSITLNKDSQMETQGTGITASLLNQSLIDYVRIIADQTYDYGQVQRDVILVRPEKNHPPYFFLLDDVFVTNPNTTVQWHLHGRGKLASGIGMSTRWTSAGFAPPRLRSTNIIMEVSHPIGRKGTRNSAPGTLYSRHSSLNQKSHHAIIEWIGSGRFCSFMIPHRSQEIALQIETLNNDACRIGLTDWLSLGNILNRVTTGPLIHVSEYSFVRDRNQSFPALLMVAGVECRFGPHSLFSNKPITASLNGLEGGFANSRPDVQVEINSPEIQEGHRFLLDGQGIRANKPGLLTFTLKNAGEHSLRRPK